VFGIRSTPPSHVAETHSHFTTVAAGVALGCDTGPGV
jgi:hypothetical protein